jgi:integrase
MKKKLEGRAIPLHQDAKVALSVWIKELEKAGKADPSSPLFKSRKGQRAITRVQAFRVLTEVYEANRLMGKLGTHSMRKTFADRIYERLGRVVNMVSRQAPEGIAGIDDQPGLGGQPGVIIGRVVGYQQHKVGVL